MTGSYGVDHPLVIDLARSLEDRGPFKARALASPGVRVGIAQVFLNSPWLQEFARRVAHDAWAEGEAAGRDNFHIEYDGLPGSAIVDNPHTRPVGLR